MDNNDIKQAQNQIQNQISQNTLKLLTIKANLSGLLANTILDYKNTINSKQDYDHVRKLVRWLNNKDVTELWKENRERIYNHSYYNSTKNK